MPRRILATLTDLRWIGKWHGNIAHKIEIRPFFEETVPWGQLVTVLNLRLNAPSLGHCIEEFLCGEAKELFDDN